MVTESDVLATVGQGFSIVCSTQGDEAGGLGVKSCHHWAGCPCSELKLKYSLASLPPTLLTCTGFLGKCGTQGYGMGWSAETSKPGYWALVRVPKLYWWWERIQKPKQQRFREDFPECQDTDGHFNLDIGSPKFFLLSKFSYWTQSCFARCSFQFGGGSVLP